MYVYKSIVGNKLMKEKCEVIKSFFFIKDFLPMKIDFIPFGFHNLYRDYFIIISSVRFVHSK